MGSDRNKISPYQGNALGASTALRAHTDNIRTLNRFMFNESSIMCGIAGILHPNSDNYQEIMERMLSALAHRGRDAQGMHLSGNMLLGHRRLSIIDTSAAGNQPMSNGDGSVWVVNNGEIYNYLELKTSLESSGHKFKSNSDTEVIPHLYEEYGDDFVSHLRGMFALAVWDQSRQRLILARDRAGKKPLFYAQIPDGIAFASEMKALFQIPDLNLEVREQAIADFLSLGAVSGADTVYQGIKRLLPGNVLVMERDKDLVCRPYWSLSLEPKLKITFEEAEEEYLRLFQESVNLRLRSDIPVGCFLSGGIDSGLVTALAATQLSRPLDTFTIGFSDQSFDERPLARLVAEQYETNHQEFLVETDIQQVVTEYITHFDQPFADPSLIPTFVVSRMAAKHTKVILSGDGADEIMGGYRHFVAALALTRLQKLGLSKLARILGPGLIRILPLPTGGRTPYQLFYRFLRVLAATDEERYFILISELFDDKEKKELFPGLSNNSNSAIQPAVRLFRDFNHDQVGGEPLNNILFNNFSHLLGDVHLVKMDIASMANTLEVRSPFLDHCLVEFAAKLPAETRCSTRRTKTLLRSLAKRFLPREIVEAPKRGFEIPLVRWMKHDIKDMWHDYLSSPGALISTYCRAADLEKLFTGKGWDEKRWAMIIWTLFCLEIWWSHYKGSILGAAGRSHDR